LAGIALYLIFYQIKFIALSLSRAHLKSPSAPLPYIIPPQAFKKLTTS